MDICVAVFIATCCSAPLFSSGYSTLSLARQAAPTLSTNSPFTPLVEAYLVHILFDWHCSATLYRKPVIKCGKSDEKQPVMHDILELSSDSDNCSHFLTYCSGYALYVKLGSYHWPIFISVCMCFGTGKKVGLPYVYFIYFLWGLCSVFLDQRNYVNCINIWYHYQSKCLYCLHRNN